MEEFFNLTGVINSERSSKVFVRIRIQSCIITARLHFILRDRRTKEEKSYWSGASKRFKVYSLLGINTLAENYLSNLK